MKRKLVVGFIGKDEPGLIQGVAELVSQHQGNWLESRMSQLAGRFAGIAVVETDDERLAALKSALLALESISSVVEETEEREVRSTRVLTMNIVGPDRPGIVKDVTSALVQHVVNVLEMDTNIAAAPMTGELTFSADASVEIPFEMDWSQLAMQLDELADELGVDIMLEDEPDQ